MSLIPQRFQSDGADDVPPRACVRVIRLMLAAGAGRPLGASKSAPWGTGLKALLVSYVI